MNNIRISDGDFVVRGPQCEISKRYVCVVFMVFTLVAFDCATKFLGMIFLEGIYECAMDGKPFKYSGFPCMNIAIDCRVN